MEISGEVQAANLFPFERDNMIYVIGMTFLAISKPEMVFELRFEICFEGEQELLASGEESAQSRGVNTTLVKRLVFLTASVLAAAIVSEVGPIGFVGIIVPHAVRMLFGADHRIVVPCSLLLGGAFLAVCDTAGAAIFPPPEIPVGVVTALVGGPFFVWLLRKGGRTIF